MQTIAHRELRNNSSSILSRVRSGESFEVTNHGDVVALLTPPQKPGSALERLRAAGETRPARPPRPPLRHIPRAPGISSEELLDDLRGE